MKAYTYSNKTSEFIAEVNITLDPVSKAQLLPASATLQEVIPTKVGFARVFKNESWDYEIDKRGEFYDASGNKIKWEELGELPEGYLTEPPEFETTDPT